MGQKKVFKEVNDNYEQAVEHLKDFDPEGSIQVGKEIVAGVSLQITPERWISIKVGTSVSAKCAADQFDDCAVTLETMAKIHTFLTLQQLLAEQLAHSNSENK